MDTPKLLFLSGSSRTGSVNKMLARYGAKIAEQQGFQSRFIDLKDYPLPLYDGDFEDENGVPENAYKLKEIIEAHQGVFIACPEYNSSITPLLKNTLDWISRTKDEDGSPSKFLKDRPVALGAASPGGLGGMRVLIGIRPILANGYNALVIPEQISVAGAYKVFDENGDMSDERLNSMLLSVVSRLGQIAQNIS